MLGALGENRFLAFFSSLTSCIFKANGVTLGQSLLTLHHPLALLCPPHGYTAPTWKIQQDLSPYVTVNGPAILIPYATFILPAMQPDIFTGSEDSDVEIFWGAIILPPTGGIFLTGEGLLNGSKLS